MQIELRTTIKDIDIVFELKKYGLKGEVTGDNLMLPCPFHNDSNPSFGIAISGDKKGLYQCFSQNCNARGTFFNLIAHLEDSNLEEVLKKYKINFDIEFVKNIKHYFKQNLKHKNKSKIKVLKKSTLKKFKKPYGDYLKYLRGRKLTLDTIKKFNLLCCDQGKWKERVIIPIYDENDRLISLTARHIYSNDKKLKVRKLKDSDVKKVLFGLKFVKDNDKKVIVEGEFDAIYLQQFNIPAIGIGSLKNLNAIQIKKLVLCTEKVGLCFDGDVDKYILREKRKAIKKYIKTKIIKLPDGKDPNDLSIRELKQLFFRGSKK